MNKLYTEGTDGKALICILEPGNIHKLVSDRKPIEFSLNDGPFKNGLPAKLSIVLAFSETPIADAKELVKLGKVGQDYRTPTLQSQRPHCPECRSTIEQLAMWRSDAPIALIFCAQCGCVLGSMAKIEGLK